MIFFYIPPRGSSSNNYKYSDISILHNKFLFGINIEIFRKKKNTKINSQRLEILAKLSKTIT